MKDKDIDRPEVSHTPGRVKTLRKSRWRRVGTSKIRLDFYSVICLVRWIMVRIGKVGREVVRKAWLSLIIKLFRAWLSRPLIIRLFPPLDYGIHDEFLRLLFLHDHREASALDNELPEESDKFRFLHHSCFGNLKGTVGCGRFDNVESIGSADFNIFGPFFSVFHPPSALHLFASSHTAFSPFPRTFCSVFCLSGTCWVYILVFHWLNYSS
jgi:hypothetical protein